MKVQMAKRSSIYYLYGLTFPLGETRGNDSLILGIEGAPVKFFTIKGLCVVYSKVPVEKYSEDSLESKVKNPYWVEDRAREHYEAQSAVMHRARTMLPFKFGTLFKSKKGLKKYIASRHQCAEELLTNLTDKQEWSVKVFADKDKLKMEVVRLNPDFKLAIEAQRDNRKGTNFLLAKKLLREIDLVANSYAREQACSLTDALEDLSVGWRQNETFTLAEQGNDEMIANFAFLVQLDSIHNFQSVIDVFNDRQPNGTIYAHYTGPWLPYNFVNELGVEPCVSA